jgi:hypothetical protein
LAKFFLLFVSFVCFCKILLVAALPRQAFASLREIRNPQSAIRNNMNFSRQDTKKAQVLCPFASLREIRKPRSTSFAGGPSSVYDPADGHS